MPGRDRSSVSQRYKGIFRRFGINWVNGGFTFGGMNSCGDVVGAGDNAPFSVSHVNFEGGVLNKPDTGFFASSFFDYVVDVLGNSNEFPHIGIDGDINNVEAATRGAAATNPSRPYVDIPVNLLELGELSRLWQVQGRGLFDTSLRSNAQANLRYQYGIRPLVGDLTKLINFQGVVHNRVKEIERLVSSKGLRRTTGVFSGSGNTKYFRVLQSDGIYADGTFDGVTTLDVRVHCRWLPTNVPALHAPNAMRDLARRAVLGLTLDQSTLWEAMPWSWLIDWCSNVGDFFKSQRNIIPATLSDLSVMRHTRTQYSLPAWSSGDATISSINAIRENKTRATSFVAPTAHIPFLNGSQMGILASLAVTRSR